MSYYNEEERTLLRSIAKESILSVLAGKTSTRPGKPELPKLIEERAVFVTLKINNELRGCIGEITASRLLYLAVFEMARSAAFRDPRFHPLTESEFKIATIDISILTPMQKVDIYTDINLGTDGVWIKKGTRSGVFLPQVAIETGWDIDTFLRILCTHKAGLPPEAYKDTSTEIYKYQVEII